ncbi:P-loop containing nucleoside triphosphate hydrolase protein [Lipomyces tetrasporus]|uniref:P-loop containing nucleoside triphosphate hydrolase protein n=1 Tax=Lipomyces tetrasporus TaxID=54092 RepID=A0AAD7QY94_9ASCO|nr:P-loop containing nucleoside triphosphate hydrolase protein [Lipomyces tetrasporus]KAJ8103221.1 P-loop containing nucleoside triphosphate hydrolase protein [Lipomyces tetrasporus]
MSESKFYLIGVSGPSSSGKSTLARLLRQVLRKSFILHEDDFYKPEAEIPVVNGIEDWDCPEAIDFIALRTAIDYIKRNRKLPDNVHYKEDQNDLGTPPVSTEEADEIKKLVLGENSVAENTEFCIVDGFLLFNDDVITKQLDIKFLLRAPYESLKKRREARSGYATIEGFWVDPPGYFENIVWPGYVRAHKHLFEGEDLEGPLAPYAIEQDIRTASAIEVHMRDLLKWALEVVGEKVSEQSS